MARIPQTHRVSVPRYYYDIIEKIAEKEGTNATEITRKALFHYIMREVRRNGIKLEFGAEPVLRVVEDR